MLVNTASDVSFPILFHAILHANESRTKTVSLTMESLALYIKWHVSNLYKTTYFNRTHPLWGPGVHEVRFSTALEQLWLYAFPNTISASYIGQHKKLPFRVKRVPLYTCLLTSLNADWSSKFFHIKLSCKSVIRSSVGILTSTKHATTLPRERFGTILTPGTHVDFRCTLFVSATECTMLKLRVRHCNWVK